MPVQTVPLDQIHASAYNPRVELKPGDDRYARIERSLHRFGLVSPLVWNHRTGNLVGGHQRLNILRAQGQTEVEVSVVDLDESDEKALNLILNSPEHTGEWDVARLHSLLGTIEDLAPDIFDEQELSLLGRIEVPGDDEAVEDEEEPELGLNSGPPAMELLPYEHYDYVVLMFKDSRDFIAAMDHFGLDKASVPSYVGSKKIGMGRVIDGGKYVHAINRKLGMQNEPEKPPVFTTTGPHPPDSDTLHASSGVEIQADPATDPVAAADQAIAEAEDKFAAAAPSGKKRK